VVFYSIGIICFIVAILIIPFWGVTLIPTALVIVLLLFGSFFIASGYAARPRQYKITTPSEPIKTEKPTEKIEEKPVQQPIAPIKPSNELSKINGLGPKRIAQLNSLQITCVEDLARSSAEDLADQLKTSRKTTAKWIEQAQDLLKAPST
jgi:predicted flap endonuclease-1-like 5' DNA nuclease